MNNSEYTISATLPIQTGKGKVEIPEENATKKQMTQREEMKNMAI